MGSGSWSNNDWKSRSALVQDKPREQIFRNRSVDPTLSPYKLEMRESVDSADNPNSTPIAIFVDVTGSMGFIAESIVRTQCGVLMQRILDDKPVTDPHVLFGAIGDVMCDDGPLQVSQYEADLRMVDHLEKIWLEGGGGGNDHESYTIPWYFCAKHTTHDAFLKRGKKGFLITMGDECPPTVLTPSQVKKVMGYETDRVYTSEELLSWVSERYHVFHLIIRQGNYCSSNGRYDAVVSQWKKLMGERAVVINDYTKLADVIVDLISSVSDSDSESNADE